MLTNDRSNAADEAPEPRRPDGSDPRYLGIEDALRRTFELEEGGLLELQERATATNREDSFTTDESRFMEYKSKPLPVVIGFALLAVVLLSARWWLWALNDALPGHPLTANLGWYTLCTMLCGAFCAFVAWPSYRRRGVSDAEIDEQARARADFRRKIHR